MSKLCADCFYVNNGTRCDKKYKSVVTGQGARVRCEEARANPKYCGVNARYWKEQEKGWKIVKSHMVNDLFRRDNEDDTIEFVVTNSSGGEAIFKITFDKKTGTATAECNPKNKLYY